MCGRYRRTTAWLGEIPVTDLKTLLRPFPASEMKMLEISQRASSRKNNDPDTIQPSDFSARLPESEELFSS
jgi:putative SOS response-associated peptidase YedK